MKTILNKIEFHYTYLLMAIGFVLGGYYLNLIVFTIVVFNLSYFVTAILRKIPVIKQLF